MERTDAQLSVIHCIGQSSSARNTANLPCLRCPTPHRRQSQTRNHALPQTPQRLRNLGPYRIPYAGKPIPTKQPLGRL